MGVAVLNALTTTRTQIKDALTAAGIKAVEYVGENLVPPVAVVIPAEPYITLGDGNILFGHYQIGTHVLLIAAKGTNKAAAEKIDSMLVDAIDALQDWGITEATQPQEVTLKGTPYIGSVLTLQQEIQITKEVI